MSLYRIVDEVSFFKKLRTVFIIFVVVATLITAYQKNGMTGVASVMASLVITPTQPQLNIGSELLNVNFSNSVTPMTTTGDCGNVTK